MDYNITMNIKTKLKNFVKSKHFIICLLTIAFIIAVDMVTKIITDGKSIIFIDSLLNFTSTHNYGGAYSIFSAYTLVLTIFSVIMIVGIILYDIFLFDGEKNTLYTISISMILGGAIGNLIDRFFLGYVRDFLELKFISFPIFNFADIMLTVGCFLFAIFIIFVYASKKRET